jgi:hypothetical protein
MLSTYGSSFCASDVVSKEELVERAWPNTIDLPEVQLIGPAEVLDDTSPLCRPATEQAPWGKPEPLDATAAPGSRRDGAQR